MIVGQHHNVTSTRLSCSIRERENHKDKCLSCFFSAPSETIWPLWENQPQRRSFNWVSAPTQQTSPFNRLSAGPRGAFYGLAALFFATDWEFSEFPIIPVTTQYWRVVSRCSEAHKTIPVFLNTVRANIRTGGSVCRMRAHRQECLGVTYVVKQHEFALSERSISMCHPLEPICVFVCRHKLQSSRTSDWMCGCATRGSTLLCNSMFREVFP